mgnify:CR=1 FL=1
MGAWGQPSKHIWIESNTTQNQRFYIKMKKEMISINKTNNNKDKINVFF